MNKIHFFKPSMNKKHTAVIVSIPYAVLCFLLFFLVKSSKLFRQHLSFCPVVWRHSRDFKGQCPTIQYRTKCPQHKRAERERENERARMCVHYTLLLAAENNLHTDGIRDRITHRSCVKSIKEQATLSVRTAPTFRRCWPVNKWLSDQSLFVGMRPFLYIISYFYTACTIPCYFVL